MTDVKMNLTEAQYRLVIGLLQTIPRAFATSNEEMDDLESDPPSRASPPPQVIAEPSGETVDLMPELSPVAKRPDGSIINLTTSLEASFNVGTIYLQLFTSAAVSKESLKQASLARFALNDTGVKYRMLSNGSMEAEFVLRSFTVNDTRTSRQTKFREIIPATTHAGHQFMINFTQSGGFDKSSFANVTIDSPKVIFSLDPVFALLDFAMSAFPKAPGAQVEVEVPDEQLVVQGTPSRSGSTFAFRVNVVSPTIILLDDPERADSEAVILSISQVQMAQQGTLALTVNKIGMFLCRVSRSSRFLFIASSLEFSF